MRVRVVAVGRLKAGPERELAERYRSRAEALSRSLGVTGPEIVEISESRRRNATERRTEEAGVSRERIGAAVSVILDETAPSLDSDAFARRLMSHRDRGQDVCFLIGGADGLSSDLRDEAGWSLSFGRLTLPHQLVRVMLLEQIYRAWTILAGHPYHRAGSDGA